MDVMRLLLIAAMVSATAGYASDDSVSTAETPKRMVTTGAHLMGGGVLGDLGTLNSDLKALGYSGLKDYSYTLGVGLMKAHRRVIHEFELKGVMWRPSSDDNSVSELYGASMLFNVGFNVLAPDGKFWLYPYVGMGWGYHSLRLREERTGLVEALAQPVSDVVLTQRTTALQAGLGFDFLLKSRRNPAHSRTVGVRAGYLFDPSPASDWRIGETTVRGDPSFSMSGVYAQLVLGRTRTRPMKWHKGGCAGDKGTCAKGGECCKKKGGEPD